MKCVWCGREIVRGTERDGWMVSIVSSPAEYTARYDCPLHRHHTPHLSRADATWVLEDLLKMERELQ